MEVMVRPGSYNETHRTQLLNLSLESIVDSAGRVNEDFPVCKLNDGHPTKEGTPSIPNGIVLDPDLLRYIRR